MGLGTERGFSQRVREKKREEGVITVEARGSMLCEWERQREQKRGKV